MPDEVRVEIRGFAELSAGSAQLADNIERAARGAFETVADEAAALTRGRVHRDTGATAASVRARPADAGAIVSMGEGVPYAIYEEYGGRGFPHNPQGNYLYPSAMSAEPLLIAQGERAAENEIGAMNWPSP